MATRFVSTWLDVDRGKSASLRTEERRPDFSFSFNFLLRWRGSSLLFLLTGKGRRRPEAADDFGDVTEANQPARSRQKKKTCLV